MTALIFFAQYLQMGYLVLQHRLYCNTGYFVGGDKVIPSQMLKGMLEGCILEIINKQETYAYEISKKLSKYGFGEISEGTIYLIILRLQKSEMINSTLLI